LRGKVAHSLSKDGRPLARSHWGLDGRNDGVRASSTRSQSPPLSKKTPNAVCAGVYTLPPAGNLPG
jgi:hypothetical protein